MCKNANYTIILMYKNRFFSVIVNAVKISDKQVNAIIVLQLAR